MPAWCHLSPCSRWSRRLLLGGFLWALAGQLAFRSASADGGAPGEKLYQKQCASCHGAQGEGTKDDYPRPLTGDRTVPQLAKLIARTMPADEPGACVGEDAENVASYVYDSFYSRAAQARNQPPRIELARLTVRQYRNAVADLIGSFREPARWDNDHRGLKGGYYNAREFQDDRRLIERVDPEVKFDFGEAGPDPDKFDAHLFSIRWEGSVLAPETGEYEFIVRTEHATRLWINDLKRPLIDAWVKSGNDTEYRGSLWLLGGRAYPVRLEFSKANQGVDETKKEKSKPPTKASIALAWKLPRQPAQVIPRPYLSPITSAQVFAASTPFPPDDRSVGYERATSISKAWEQATTDAAIETTDYIVAHLKELAGTRADDPDGEPKLREFGQRFAERAFRRPLTDEQKQVFIARQFETAKDRETAVKRVVLLVLKSPRFLYREVGGAGGGGDAYDVAARLAFGLWDALPDRELTEAAAAGKLGTREEVARQAERMMPDLRTHAKLRAFFLQWLKVEQVPELSKDPALYPDFNPELVADLRASLDLFLDDMVWGEASDFRRLFQADELYLNGRMAKFYGADLPPDAPFQKVKLEPAERAGLVTHPYLLADFAYTATSSPIHRGVFLARGALGRTLRPPPQAVAPLAPDLHPDLTTRQRVTLQTSPETCQACHGMINPLGFALEHFDAAGRFRSEEQGKPIDATGSYLTRTGDTVSFHGARELAAFLADSDESRTAFVEHLFHHLVKQPIRAYGLRTSSDLRQNFIENDFHIRKLVVEIVTTAALAKPETQAASLDEHIEGTAEWGQAPLCVRSQSPFRSPMGLVLTLSPRGRGEGEGDTLVGWVSAAQPTKGSQCRWVALR